MPLQGARGDERERALIEPMAVAVRIVQSAGVKAGDNVAILGAGNIGLLVLQTAFIFGAGSVAITDPVSSRLDVARQLGAVDFAAEDSIGQFDVVIDGAGTPQTFDLCVRLARSGGSIAVYGVPGIERPELPMLEMFRKDLRVAFKRLYPSDMSEAIRLLHEGRINWQTIVTHRVSLEELPDAISAVMADPGAGIKILVQINQRGA